MIEQHQIILMAKGIVLDLPAEERQKFDVALQEIRDAVEAAGELPGRLAVTIVGAEMCLDPEDQV